MSAYNERMLRYRALYHLGGIAPTSSEAKQVANYMLKSWAKSQRVFCDGEIKRDTGMRKDTNLGREHKQRIGRANDHIEPMLDYDEYLRANRIVLSLSEIAKKVIYNNYKTRPSDMSLKKFLESGEAVTDKRWNYYKLLGAAQQEAIARGILG